MRGSGPGEQRTGTDPGPRPDVVLVRGPIEATEGTAFTVHGADGVRRIETDAKTGFGILTRTALDSIRPGEFVGVTSERRADGGLQAVEVHIFPESLRGTGEGHYPWDLPRPGGTTMTNATVADVVTKVDGPVLTLSPQGQPIQITVPPTAPVVRIVLSASADVLRAGYGAVVVTRKAPDGHLIALRVYTGEAGAMPAI
jgi:hypothetical protein